MLYAVRVAFRTITVPSRNAPSLTILTFFLIDFQNCVLSCNGMPIFISELIFVKKVRDAPKSDGKVMDEIASLTG